MIQNLYYLLLLLAGFPTGLILAKLCKEELKKWGVKYHEAKVGKPYYDLFFGDKTVKGRNWL